MSSGAPLTVSVVIPTYQRPDYLRTCLSRLHELTVAPDDVVVVDASQDNRSYDVVGAFDHVRYVRSPFGPGTLASSRNIGLNEVTTDIVAYVDDDAYPRPDWLAELLHPYADPAVGGVGGRVTNGLPGEDNASDEPVGRFLSDGSVVGNFYLDTGLPVEVDHFIGANMSYRRSALLGIGGIIDIYPGTSLREDTGLGLRVKQAGWKLVYVPTARIDHVTAPYEKGQRFDRRYTYYAQRNHLVMVGSIFGARSPEFRGSLRSTVRLLASDATTIRDSVRYTSGATWKRSARRVAGRLAHSGVVLVGTVAGCAQLERPLERRPEAPPSSVGDVR
jgi:GT2 family glycosyltransferase